MYVYTGYWSAKIDNMAWMYEVRSSYWYICAGYSLGNFDLVSDPSDVLPVYF